MGRFSEPLSVQFINRVGLPRGARVLDVGSGPGALTGELVNLFGEAAVTAIDPSRSFVDALRERWPGVDVRTGVAEALPFDDGEFDAALAQLVVHFMGDPLQGLAEMRRVTRPGGVVASCVWDHADAGGGPLTLFWQAVHDLDPSVRGEGQRAGTREGDLVRLSEAAGLAEVEAATLTVRVGFGTKEEWWEPFLLGVGPAGAYVAGLTETDREALRDRCLELLPPAPFEVTVRAWCALGRA